MSKETQEAYLPIEMEAPHKDVGGGSAVAPKRTVPEPEKIAVLSLFLS